MAVANIGDLLDRVADFEQRLDRYYAEIRDQSEDNGVRLLTYHLSRHGRHLPKVLEEYSPQVIENIWRIGLRRNIPFVPTKEFYALGIPAGVVHGQELLEAAIKYDTVLVSLYREILEQPLMDQAQELFDSLIRVEERDIGMLKKMAAMHYF